MSFSPLRPESGGPTTVPGLVASQRPGHDSATSAEFVSSHEQSNPYLGMPNPLNQAGEQSKPFLGVPSPLNEAGNLYVTPDWGVAPATGLYPFAEYGIAHHSADHSGPPPPPPPRPVMTGGGSGGLPHAPAGWAGAGGAAMRVS